MRWMKRLAAAALLCVVSSLGIVPLSAQPSWSAYLYDSLTGELLRVALDGTITPLSLGVPEGVYISSRDMGFSPDGSRAAFCVVDYASTGAQPPARLIIRDLNAGVTTAEVDLGGAIGCRVTSSAEGDALAVGIVRYFEGDPAADTSGPSWTLQVRDFEAGGLITELAADSPLITSADGDVGGILPTVKYFEGGRIAYAEVFYGAGGAPAYPAYLWDIRANTLVPAPVWGESTLTYFPPTNDILWAGYDETAPVGNPGGPIPASNVVGRAMVTDGIPDESMWVYETGPDWVVLSARYIDGGDVIAVELLSSFVPEATPVTRWIGVTPSGSVTELQGDTAVSSMVNAPSGYLFLRGQYMGEVGENPTVSLEYHRDGAFDVLWNAPTEGFGWEIAWTTPQ